MKVQSKKLNFAGQEIFVGIDTHKETWRVATCTRHTAASKWPATIRKPFVTNVKKYLDKHFPGATFLCVYEAGFCGFWIKESMDKVGLPTIVVHAADVPTNDKERKQKGDKRDARKLASALKNGQLKEIYVPTRSKQLDRSVVRERYSIASSLRRIKTQIRSHLAFFNIEVSEEKLDQHWSRKYISWLESVQCDTRDDRLGLMIDRLHSMRQLKLKANQVLRNMSKSNEYSKLYNRLSSVPGIGLVTGMLLIGEIIDMNRFPNDDCLCSYVGFIPTTNSSGEKEKKGNLTQRCNKRLRSALIESSWSAIRHDQELLLKYETYRERMNGKHAIVKIARILLRRIRHVWLNEVSYQKAEI